MTGFFRAGDRLLRVEDVCQVDVSRLVEHQVVVYMADRHVAVLTGTDAVELVMLLKPSALEGRRLRWARHAWSVHNMVGHPLMQVLAWLGKPRWGVWVHDVTTPRPQGDAR